jgi:hypothetical protein
MEYFGCTPNFLFTYFAFALETPILILNAIWHTLPFEQKRKLYFRTLLRRILLILHPYGFSFGDWIVPDKVLYAGFRLPDSETYSMTAFRIDIEESAKILFYSDVIQKHFFEIDFTVNDGPIFLFSKCTLWETIDNVSFEHRLHELARLFTWCTKIAQIVGPGMKIHHGYPRIFVKSPNSKIERCLEFSFDYRDIIGQSLFISLRHFTREQDKLLTRTYYGIPYVCIISEHYGSDTRFFEHWAKKAKRSSTIDPITHLQKLINDPDNDYFINGPA